MSGEARMPANAAGLLVGLNDDQCAAVTATDASILVVAGPGSGKTRVIAHRIAYAVRYRGLPAERIVAVTFTNRAAEEMRTRVERLLGTECTVRIGTFHWLCGAILRRYADRIGRRRDFRLLSPREASALVRRIQAELWPKAQPGRECADAVSALKNGMQLDQAAAAFSVPAEHVRRLLDTYDERLRRAGAFDLDDLLAKSVLLLREHDDVRTRCASAIADLLVDEYQDSNPVQQDLLALLRPAAGSLVAVGDEDQSIYGWRQAGNGTAAQFQECFPGARIIILRSTYRCSRHILRAASSLITHNKRRTDKPLATAQPAGERPICYAAADERDEAEWIAAQIADLSTREGINHDSMGILYRTNVQSRAVEEALVRRGIPYTVRSGTRFYDLPEIRLLAAVLRLAVDPSNDEAAALILGHVPGIGERRVALLRARAAEQSESLRALLASPDLPLPTRLRAAVSTLDTQLASLERVRRGAVVSVVDAAISVVAALLPDRRQTLLADDDPLDEVRAMIQESNPRELTLLGLTDRITLAGPTNDGPGVSLLTLHAAKGLEFDVVFLPGVEEGLLPHRRSLESSCALEEERRLCYVGMTRARQRLFISYARMRLLGGHALLGGASRFIGEIGPANISLRSSAALLRRPRLVEVRPGERVAHPRWQAGTVLSVDGQGRDTMVTIDFGARGTRRLQLCHAPLERLPVEDAHVAAG